MSDADSSLEVSAVLEDEEDENSEVSIAKWNLGKWHQQKTGKSNIIHFVLENTEIGETQDLPVARLEWDLEDLNLTLTKEKKKVKLIGFDVDVKMITIVTDISYNGPSSQLLQLRNFDTNENVENPTFEELFAFIKNYHFQIEETQPSSSITTPKTDSKTKKRKQKDSEKDGEKGSETKKPRNATVKESSVSEIYKDVLTDLDSKISKEQHPKFNTKTLSLEVLQPNFTFRTISKANVDYFVDLKKKGTFNPGYPLLVNKMKNSGEYIIFDGNCRFEATNEHNKEADRPVMTVICNVYEDLSFEQMLLVRNEASEQSPNFKQTILQMTKNVSKIMAERKISLPTTAKDQVKLFEKLMQTYFRNRYYPVCTDLLRLPSEILDAIYETCCNDTLIEHLPLPSTFWSAFATAAKKDPIKALEYLATLKSEDDTKKVQKKLNEIELNLLNYLSKRAEHTYETEDEAIKKLSDGRIVCKDVFVKVLHKTNFYHNKSRGSGKNFWENTAKKIKDELDKYLLYKNAKYIEEVDETLLSKQNLIITENPTKSFLELLEKCYTNYVIIIIALRNEEAPKLINVLPTAEFDIRVEGLITIDQPFTSIPRNTVNAALYIPNAPETNKMRFFSELVIEKKCKLASTIDLYDSHELAKLVEESNRALIHCSSLKIATHFLSNLKHFKMVYVTGDKRHKDLAETLSKTNIANETNETTLNLDSTLEAEETLQDAEESIIQI